MLTLTKWPYNGPALACSLLLLAFIRLLTAKTFDFSTFVTSFSGSNLANLHPSKQTPACDIFQGQWLPSESTLNKSKTSASCPHRNENWACERKPFRVPLVWKPHACSLRPLSDTTALELLRGKRIGCIGDSLCQNFHETLICNLLAIDPGLHQIDDGVSHRVFHSNRFNLTVMGCFSEYLVHRDSSEESFEKLGMEKGADPSHSLVHVDVIDPVIARCLKRMDVVVFGSGQWWLGKPKVYMLGGVPEELSVEDALVGGLRTLTNHVLTSKYSGLAIFRTITPSHFFGGTWQTAGTCPQTQPLSAEGIEANAREYGGSMTLRILELQREFFGGAGGRNFKLMDVYPLSVARADGHPGNYTKSGLWDCIHWCEPGVLDTWTQVLYAMIEEHYRTYRPMLDK